MKAPSVVSNIEQVDVEPIAFVVLELGHDRVSHHEDIRSERMRFRFRIDMYPSRIG